MSRENKHINTTIRLAGRRKSKIFFSEYRIHKNPAEIHPSEIKIKYNALAAETAGYEDHNDVDKNHRPGIINIK